MTAATKGKWTFRTAAVLFVISALTELVPPTAPVPLFGAMQGDPAALFYHVFYAGLYVGLGVGLWQAKPWGYTLVLFTTGVYTLDRLQLLLTRKAVLADLLRQPDPLGEVLAAGGHGLEGAGNGSPGQFLGAGDTLSAGLRKRRRPMAEEEVGSGLRTALTLVDRSPLGSAAGYGSPIALDRELVADDRVLRTQQRLEQSAVGIKA